MSARTWRRKRCYEPTEPPITEMARARKDFPALTLSWPPSPPRSHGRARSVSRRLVLPRLSPGLREFAPRCWSRPGSASPWPFSVFAVNSCSGQVTVEEFTPFYLPRAAPQGQSPTWGASVRVWTFETHKPPISDFAEHSRVFVAEGA